MLSSITEPKFPNAALGITGSGITAVALQGGGKRGYSVKQAATVDLPAGLLYPSFLDSNITDHIEFAAALKEAAHLAGLLKQKRWSVALPGNSARSAILTLDSVPANKNEAEEILDWKAAQSFGAPADELRLSMQKISPDREGRSRYFATAVTLTVIDEYETHFETLGWKAGLILPRAIGEANWLLSNRSLSDSLLISGNNDGFTAVLLRGTEPAVVRSVTCQPSEIDDEVYRLVMFYNDRFGGEAGGMLERLLVVGDEFAGDRIQTIASDALGRRVEVLSNHEVGLNLPPAGLKFSDLAAPAGLAALAF